MKANGNSDNAAPTALVAAAAGAARASYSPYSKFPVGAALLLPGGGLMTGCNVENASYGLTVCAERVAFFKAVSEGRRDFVALAVVAGQDEAAPPCGACLQVMAEFCGPGFPIYLAALNRPDSIRMVTLGELLPSMFKLPPR